LIKFSDSASKNVGTVTEILTHRDKNSIFIPAKEVLSLFKVIKKSREIDRNFGFDDTYLDLVNALEKEPQRGKNSTHFSNSKKILKKLIHGRISYSKSGTWHFHKGNMKIPISSTAEGIKKIGIIDRLLSNRYLERGSTIFIDEPESFLHPKAIIEFMDILVLLAKSDIQIFLSTHSYFVINKLKLIAKKENMDIPIISLLEDSYEVSNLKDGLPDNPIIDTSIALYEEELDLEL